MPDTYKLQDGNNGFVFFLYFYSYFLWLDWYLQLNLGKFD